jgi:hypothetical protein
MLDLAKTKGWTFDRVGGPEIAYEMTVLEYEFAFWQWGGISSDKIPLEGTEKEMFSNFAKIGDFSYFSDQEIKKIEGYFYQAMTEIGYYGYQFEKFKDYLKYAKDSDKPDFTFAAPLNTDLTFNYDLMPKVKSYIQNKADNFCFIYGGMDTWYATSVQLSPRTNSVKVVKSNGDHLTRIKNMGVDERQVVFTNLSKWLGEEVVDPFKPISKE